MALGDDVGKLREKAEEHAKTIAMLTERLDTALAEIETMYTTLRETERNLADVRREAERDGAVLKRDLADLIKWRDEWGRRLWAFGPSLLGAIVGGAIVLAVQYFFPRR